LKKLNLKYPKELVDFYLEFGYGGKREVINQETVFNSVSEKLKREKTSSKYR
jgi:hypothetical protein